MELDSLIILNEIFNCMGLLLCKKLIYFQKSKKKVIITVLSSLIRQTLINNKVLL